MWVSAFAAGSLVITKATSLSMECRARHRKAATRVPLNTPRVKGWKLWNLVTSINLVESWLSVVPTSSTTPLS